MVFYFIKMVWLFIGYVIIEHYICMALWRYQIYLRMLKNISREDSKEKRNFVYPQPCHILYLFTP